MKKNTRDNEQMLRRTAAMNESLPWLHLKGISTGDFAEALKAQVGPQARGLSSSTISRLKQVWAREYEEWSQRDLRGQRFVYLWIDGIDRAVEGSGTSPASRLSRECVAACLWLSRVYAEVNSTMEHDARCKASTLGSACAGTGR